MQYTVLFQGHKIWVWFILLSVVIGLLVSLFSGSLHIKRTMRADAPLEDFKGHMNERIPALMKLYKIPGCSIALVGRRNRMDKAYGYADSESGGRLTADTPMTCNHYKTVTAMAVRLAERAD